MVHKCKLNSSGHNSIINISSSSLARLVGHLLHTQGYDSCRSGTEVLLLLQWFCSRALLHHWLLQHGAILLHQPGYWQQLHSLLQYFCNAHNFYLLQQRSAHKCGAVHCSARKDVSMLQAVVVLCTTKYFTMHNHSYD